MQAALIASALGFTSVATFAAVSLIGAPPPRSDALLELQTGPVVVELFAETAPARVKAVRGCWTDGCPLIQMRVASAAPEGPEEEPGRVQRLSPASFEDGGLGVEIRGDLLGEEGRVGEAAGAEAGKDGEAGQDRLPPV